jgi:hypothetical protein
MQTRILALFMLVFLSACSQEEPSQRQDKSIGGQIGDSYKGMLDSARQGAEDASDQMRRSDQAARERNE